MAQVRAGRGKMEREGTHLTPVARPEKQTECEGRGREEPELASALDLGASRAQHYPPSPRGLPVDEAGFPNQNLEDCLNIFTLGSKRKLTLAGSFNECKITRKDIPRHSGIQQMDQAIMLKTVNHNLNFS